MTDNANHAKRQWAPTCRLAALQARADAYCRIRSFFAARQVLEVETPIMGSSTATDPFLASIPAVLTCSPGQAPQRYFLHTSPEFPMKRLLAAGSGAIYQICKTFRDGESGKRHNPEFTMLEWYRPGLVLSQLMAEVAELVSDVLQAPELTIRQLSYREAFLEYLDIDPFQVADAMLQALVVQHCGFAGSAGDLSRDDLLNLLLTHCIEPHLGQKEDQSPALCFLHGYPASQASLAKLTRDDDGQVVAERFELYIKGLEIANGYFELTDALEQAQRFEQDNLQRELLALPQIPPDQHLLAALAHGLPSCSGVALGVDRLLMIKLGADSIDEVLTFPLARV